MAIAMGLTACGGDNLEYHPTREISVQELSAWASVDTMHPLTPEAYARILNQWLEISYEWRDSSFGLRAFIDNLNELLADFRYEHRIAVRRERNAAEDIYWHTGRIAQRAGSGAELWHSLAIALLNELYVYMPTPPAEVEEFNALWEPEIYEETARQRLVVMSHMYSLATGTDPLFHAHFVAHFAELLREDIEAAEEVLAELAELELLRCDCGMFFAEDLLRFRTPPISMVEEPTDEFLANFATVHHFTYNQQYPHPYTYRIVFYTDEPVRDFSFISLSHAWVLGQLYYYTWEELYTIDELLPGDAFVLDVLFFHYLISQGGVAFTAANGERRHIRIIESMAGGCMSGVLLSYFEDRMAIPPQDRTTSMEPDSVQQTILENLLGEFTLGEIAPLTSHQDDREAFVFRMIHYDRRATFYNTPAYSQAAISDAARALLELDAVYFSSLSLTPATQEGDAILVHSERFDRLFLVIDLGATQWGNAVYAVVTLP